MLEPLSNLGSELAKARIHVKLDSDEIKKLLKSQELTDFLKDRGEDVASNAGAEYEVQVDRESRKTRVVVNVIDPRPAAKFIEMQTGRLARALGEASR